MKEHGRPFGWVKNWPKAIRRRIAFGYCVLLIYLLLTPSPLSPFGDWGLETEGVIDGTLSSSLQHIIAYGILVGIFWWSRDKSPSQNFWVLILASSGHGMVCEGLQSFVPQREADGRDLFCNLLGVGLGAVISWGWTVRERRMVQTPSSETPVGPLFASRVPQEQGK